MAFSFLAYLCSFWRYFCFCIISDDVIRQGEGLLESLLMRTTTQVE